MFALIPYIWLLGKRGLYPLLLLGISSFSSIFSFAFTIQTKMPRSPRLAHKAPVMQATVHVRYWLSQG